MNQKRNYDVSSSALKSSTKRPTAPPIVRSTAAPSPSSGPDGTDGGEATSRTSRTGAGAGTFKILDAQIESDDDDSDIHGGATRHSLDPVQRKLQAYTQSKNRKLTVNRGRQQDQTTAEEEEEEEERLMTNFIPMLQEYLSREFSGHPCFLRGCSKRSSGAWLVHPNTPSDHSLSISVLHFVSLPSVSSPSTPSKSTAVAESSTRGTPPDTPSSSRNDDSPPHPGYSNAPDMSSGDAADSDSEWVYDVYYRDAAPSPATATIFHTTRSGIDAFDMGSGEGLRKIGAL